VDVLRTDDMCSEISAGNLTSPYSFTVGMSVVIETFVILAY
jgi:hypothetical protein